MVVRFRGVDRELLRVAGREVKAPAICSCDTSAAIKATTRTSTFLLMVEVGGEMSG